MAIGACWVARPDTAAEDGSLLSPLELFYNFSISGYKSIKMFLLGHCHLWKSMSQQLLERGDGHTWVLC